MTENRRNYFFWNKEGFEGALRERVCPVCDHRGEGGSCLYRDGREPCPLFHYLPELVVTAQRLGRPTATQYTEAVQHDENIWLTREFRQLLPLVLETIEEEDLVLENRPGFGT